MPEKIKKQRETESSHKTFQKHKKCFSEKIKTQNVKCSKTGESEKFTHYFRQKTYKNRYKKEPIITQKALSAFIHISQQRPFQTRTIFPLENVSEKKIQSKASVSQHKTNRKCAWISSSRRNWLSTFAATSCDLNKTWNWSLKNGTPLTIHMSKMFKVWRKKET